MSTEPGVSPKHCHVWPSLLPAKWQIKMCIISLESKDSQVPLKMGEKGRDRRTSRNNSKESLLSQSNKTFSMKKEETRLVSHHWL